MRTKPKAEQSSYNSQQFEQEDLSSADPIKSDHFRHKKRSRWTPEQNLRYASFLKENVANFKSTQLRKKNSVFCQLSKHMKTRSTVQAKSHHQKMIKRHGQVQKIIEHLEVKFLVKIEAKHEAYSTNDRKLAKSCQIEQKWDYARQQINQNTDAIKMEGPEFFWDDEEVQNNKEWFQDI